MEARLKLSSEKPDIIAINETFLNRSVEQVNLTGYVLISRRDRRDNSGFGGIAVFARVGVASYITFLESSDSDERSWHVIHSDIGPVLLGIWYRPPQNGEIESIRNLENEWKRLQSQYIGTIIVGDLNVHHIRWLHFSSHTSVEGSLLWRFCTDHGFRQTVGAPTRGNHLLDLVLTDMDEVTDSCVLLTIADHCLVRSYIELQVPES